MVTLPGFLSPLQLQHFHRAWYQRQHHNSLCQSILGGRCSQDKIVSFVPQKYIQWGLLWGSFKLIVAHLTESDDEALQDVLSAILSPRPPPKPPSAEPEVSIVGGAVLVEGVIREISAEEASVIVQNVDVTAKAPAVTPTKINSSVFGRSVPTQESVQPAAKGKYLLDFRTLYDHVYNISCSHFI